MELNSTERTYLLEPGEGAAAYLSSLRANLYRKGFVPAWRRQRDSPGMSYVTIVAHMGNTYELKVSDEMSRAVISSHDITNPDYEESDVELIRQCVEEVIERRPKEPAPATRVEM